MDTKQTKILGLLLFCSLLIGANCRKDRCVSVNYSFKIGVKATPNLDSININDTIWFEINESTVLQNLENNAMIDYSNATYLGGSVGFQEVNSATQFRSAANDFDFKLLIGTETANTNPALFRAFILSEVSSRYILKLGVIPRALGVFRILFGSAANVSRNNSNCEKASFQIDFKETDQHGYLYPGGAGVPQSGGTYYFKVK